MAKFAVPPLPMKIRVANTLVVLSVFWVTRKFFDPHFPVAMIFSLLLVPDITRLALAFLAWGCAPVNPSKKDRS